MEVGRGLSANVSDYFYWFKYDFDNLFKLYDGSGGYLVFRPYPGGFNNIRMSLELAAIFAYLKNRTLVLPPAYHMYLLKGDSSLSDFFDLEDIGLETVGFEEFCDREGIKRSWDAVAQKYTPIDIRDTKQRNPNTGDKSFNFEKITPPKSFTRWKRLIHWEEVADDSQQVLFFNKSLIGTFYQVAYSSRMQQLKQYIARHIHYRTDIFDLAWEFINQLGDQDYYATHIRRNDFQYKHVRIPCEDIVKHLDTRVPSGSKLYIATDHKKKDFFKPLEDKYDVYYYGDMSSAKEVDYNLIPIIEQLICTRAVLFIGQDYSTLSSYIYRLRGYMADIENKDFHVNTEEYKISDQLPLFLIPHFVGNWHREYKDAWDFYEPTIFISIASYRDSQLHKTIESALKHAANPGRIFIGINLQDSGQYYQKLLSKSYPQTKILLTPPDQSHGVVSARRTIIDELYAKEDYFLQIDSHTRFKDNWDNILINQIQAIPSDKVILSTYPNEFTYPDPHREYLKLPYNAPLIFDRFLNENRRDNRFKPRNLVSLTDYDVVDNKRVAAGFLFTDSRWIKEVPLPAKGIICSGEEDYMTYLSFLKGWDIKVPSEAVVWHNYDWKDRDGKPYRLLYSSLGKGVEDRTVDIINDVLFKQRHERSLQELENYLGVVFKKP
ncbi:GlcNAc-transferase family protein [candidate division CSSED10-310 bacterium]|uniref:GlcNAc-transferase family protein n=1 Tax=candidate division CSSED10-310 bacterium TaxID=2855610 RepID=A0ABV6Z1J1_UNCC1